MDAITTTLNKIKAQSPCTDGYQKLVKSLGGLKYGMNTPITFAQIYASNGYNDTLWCLRAVDKTFYPLWRHFAVDAAQAVEHLMTDERSKSALKVARKYADGKATDEELDAARAAAWDAAGDAAWAAARAAAWAAAWAAARDAAWAAAWDAAGAAAWAAARDAAGAAAWDAARAAAWDAARAAARDAQMKLLVDYCKTGKRPRNSAAVLKRYIKEAMEGVA